MTEVQERRKKTVEASMTEQVHLIMQQHLNGGGRLFGGALMQWLDEVAGVVAMRHAETYRVVTAAVDNLQFKHAIYEGEIVVLKGYVTYVGRTSMEVEIDTYVEQPDGMRHTVNRAFFVMVADFSSVAMDFAYMKKPLVYYQFDNEKFRQSHHQIGYFDFRKDGFGPVCVTEQEVTDWLIRLHKQGFANEEIYLERHGKYFDLWDTKNCERNYKAIKEM